MDGRLGHLTVLVPVRNAGHLLPDWLSSVSGYAQAVIALDDGSTDDTRAILEAHPLVTNVLSNPLRQSYRGWDDLGNRQRLVWAALAAGVEWLLFLDADERIAPDDTKALRRLLEVEAQPGHAYGFEVFRMVQDEAHFDPRALWVFRLFHVSDARSPLGSQRLHFVPVPSEIARNRWLFTSVRIQHFGSLTAEHRRERFAKYLEADPECENQSDYSNLLEDPEVISEWPGRAPETPALVGSEGRYLDFATELASVRPAWTAVVIARNDEAVIDRALLALLSQDVLDGVEIIVVSSGTDRTAERAKAHGVRVIQLPGPALPGEARNAGLWAANGEYVTFPGSHVWLLPGSLASRLAAHESGWDMVTTSVANGNATRSGWASYFLDHAAQTPAAPSGEFHGVPGHASYVTAQVRSVGGFPEDMRTGEDTVVNRRLTLDGKRSFFCSEATFAHASPSTSLRHLAKHHFQRGRGLGKIIKGTRRRGTIKQLAANLDLPKRRLRYIEQGLKEANDPELSARFQAVEPLVRVGVMAASAGCWFELLRATPWSNQSVDVAAPVRAQPRDERPWVVVAGRPYEAACGLLAAGASSDAIRHLATLTKYAESVREVRPALGLIATSATLTAEQHGTYTLDLPSDVIQTYWRDARRSGVGLWLIVQPGRARLTELAERWEAWLREPQVGILFDLRQHLAHPGQSSQAALTEASSLISERCGPSTPVGVLATGMEHDAYAEAGVTVGQLLRLQDGDQYPHAVLSTADHHQMLVYM